jgi:predicted murein hydrolase (TIGR00659 family)
VSPELPQRVSEIWVYLSTTPLLGLTVTLLAYQGAYWLYRKADFHPLANPVLWSVIALVLLLSLTGTPYQTYFDGAQFVHFLLGPATVALAVPLHAQLPRLRRLALPLLVALLAGSLVAAFSALLIGYLLGGSTATILSLAPKSVTTPIAMGIAEKIGGLPSLTAVLVITTGIIGAVLGRYVLDALRIRDHAVRGFSIGVAAHGIGTARAFQVSEQAGAFAALAMGLNGLLTAILLPVLLPLVTPLLR